MEEVAEEQQVSLDKRLSDFTFTKRNGRVVYAKDNNSQLTILCTRSQEAKTITPFREGETDLNTEERKQVEREG